MSSIVIRVTRYAPDAGWYVEVYPVTIPEVSHEVTGVVLVPRERLVRPDRDAAAATPAAHAATAARKRRRAATSVRPLRLGKAVNGRRSCLL
jgi:hypothetical protein